MLRAELPVQRNRTLNGLSLMTTPMRRAGASRVSLPECRPNCSRITRRTAIVGEVTDQLVHYTVVGAVDQLTAGANLLDETRAL